MSKKKTATKRRAPASASAKAAPPSGGTSHAVRETIESIVIAFVLAFLFRTFEAEAFVIPTGSMSPALQGQHKDVDCSECGYRFRTTASSEGEDRNTMIARLRDPRLSLGNRDMLQRRIAGLEILGGVCPMCRQTMAMRSDLPPGVPGFVNLAAAEEGHTSYPGDRILVNKFIYATQEPQRWDVVVFKYPGNGTMNYIKRLIGLPGETLQVYQGDIFTRQDDQESEFRIERKPPHVVHAMLQPVHDTDHEPASLYNAGWPLRWAATTDDGWQVDATAGEQTVKQSFQIASAQEDSIAWLRYRHLLPENEQWEAILSRRDSSNLPKISKEDFAALAEPHLIRDYNAYNALKRRDGVSMHGWEGSPAYLAMHWVGDLAVRCEVEVQQASGELHLDLVEAGKHFSCQIDLESGLATLGIDGLKDYKPSAITSIDSVGSYELLLANVDDQLLLWVDGDVIPFGDTTYDADQLVAGGRENALPKTSESDLGDLSPAGVGARGAALTVTRLEVLRDIYYVATRSKKNHGGRSDYNIADYDVAKWRGIRDSRELYTNPDNWSIFSTRRREEFNLDQDQLFVMGDNSPQSQDCRLWIAGNPKDGSRPGGPYLDRRLLIGKAVCVFWPHSWGSIPGLKKLPGFPNFGDMRLIR